MRELSPALRLAAFGAGLVVVLGAALGAGRVTGDLALAAPEPAPEAAGHDGGHDGGHEAGPTASDVTGTSLSAGGLRLEAPRTTLPPLESTPFMFRVREGAQIVREFDVEQGKQMHLVIVSRDLSRHAHVHPERAADGTWTALLTLGPGAYRAVADFSTGGERRSLGIDLAVAGPLTVAPLPPPATSVRVDDLRVELERDGLDFTFTAYDATGRQVVPEPYLGARGHLVAFREGDLAYAHVHPAGEDGARTTYEAELPGPGTYRLFLEIKVGGSVRTAPFTVEVPA